MKNRLNLKDQESNSQLAKAQNVQFDPSIPRYGSQTSEEADDAYTGIAVKDTSKLTSHQFLYSGITGAEASEPSVTEIVPQKKQF